MMLWKVTITTTHIFLSELYRGGYLKPNKVVKVYRWWWRARLATFLYNVPALGVPIFVSAEMEPYRPDANVVALPKRAA